MIKNKYFNKQFLLEIKFAFQQELITKIAHFETFVITVMNKFSE